MEEEEWVEEEVEEEEWDLDIQQFRNNISIPKIDIRTFRAQHIHLYQCKIVCQSSIASAVSD